MLGFRMKMLGFWNKASLPLMFRYQATVLIVLYSTTDIVVSYPATDDIVVSCSLWFVTIVEPMSFAATAATLQPNGLRNDTTPPLVSTLFYLMTNLLRIEPCGREPCQEINNLIFLTNIDKCRGHLKKEVESPIIAFLPDAITFSDGKPTSETSELNPEDVTARLEDLEVEIDTLHADTEDKELLISELQDSLAAAE
ncbi:hypothetical protein Tco_1386168 [Tanacetum coccineum]